MKKLNNKGAALVSVMIAITFVSIVATSLLVIALNNYQMKVVSIQSKSNFYETEQRINVVTATVRDKLSGSSNPNGDLGSIVNGSTTLDYNQASFPYKAEKIADLAFPGKSTSSDSNGVYVKVWDDPAREGNESYPYDKFYFKDGTVKVETKQNGKKITLDNLTIKQVSSDGKGGYENSIKTDLNIFCEIPPSGGGAVGGVGSCAFLIDSTIKADPNDHSTRLNISGNTIMGQYQSGSGSYTTSFYGGTEQNKTVTAYSIPTSVGKSKTGDTVTSVNNNQENAIIYLKDCAYMNFNSANNVIFGDVFLCGKSVLTVLENGSFTVYGDIFIAEKAAFICKGELRLGYNSNVYTVNSGTSGGVTKLNGPNPSKNFVCDTVTHLDKKNYDKMADYLNLFDSNHDNDGILPKILKPNSSGKYYYEAADAYQTKTNTLCTFNGIDYAACYPAGDLGFADNSSTNAPKYYNELILVNDRVNNSKTKITSSIPNSTIISRKPVYVYDTMNINVSKMGDQAFHYILTHDNCKINFKAYGSNDTNAVSICDFFDPNCDTYVSNVFSISQANDTSSGPTTVTKTAISFTEWNKDAE